jgi:ribosome biogenesis GTPase A
MKLWLINQCKFLIANCKTPSNVSRSLSTKVNSKNDEHPSTNINEKLVKLAIIGIPNAGKSTFINNLINHRVGKHLIMI